MLAVHLLRDQTINPGWFGHPGTTTIYTLALIDIGTFVTGLVSGRFTDVRHFTAAVYFDPSIIFLPGRVFIALCGVACVGLIFRIGQRLYGVRTGLIAGALLAIDPVHIQLSQIIRTDVHASVFMLAAVLGAISIAQTGRVRDYVLTGIWIGLACATKWPAAAVGFSALGGCAWRIVHHPSERPRQLGRMALLIAVAFASLVIASPYLVLDWRTLLQDIQGQAKTSHVGANGGDLAFNLSWYIVNPLRTSLGVFGLLLAAAGVWIGIARNRMLLSCVLPGASVFLLAMGLSPLIWARWVAPLLPYTALLAAITIDALASFARARLGAPAGAMVLAGTVATLALPMLVTDAEQATERRHDTRALASAWVRARIPANATITVEHAAFDLMRGPWRLMFPLGKIGCVDVHRVLGGTIRYQRVDKVRRSDAAMDLGSVDPAKLDSCRADWIIATNYGRYLAESERYGREVAQYHTLFAGGTVRAVFRPVPGEVGGPVVYVVERNTQG